MYCKGKWCSAARKGPLSGRVGSFQMHSINKMRRFQDLKSAAKLRQGRLVPVGRSREIARRCTYTHSKKRCGNTGLLTCVGERASLLRPHPAFSQVFPAMADFRPGGLMTASVWPHAHSTVSCRHNACFLAYPAQMGFAESACITVLIQLYKETHLEIVSPDEKGQPFSTASILPLSYPNGGHFASCFLCAACICLQKRNGPWAVPFFVIRRSSE